MRKILLIGRNDSTTRMVYHHLCEYTTVVKVILEEEVPGSQVFARRRKKLGLVTAIGQGLFVKLLLPLLRKTGQKRYVDLGQQLQLSDEVLPQECVQHVATVNDEEVITAINAIQPEYIIVNGTRLISASQLSKIHTPIINLHLGWNPQYRGGNGGYWALVQGDKEHCGVTVHLIDGGIDTGGVLARSLIEPTKEDTFVTYPLLQLHAGLEALRRVLEVGELKTEDTSHEHSGMWYHPTVWSYLWNRMTKGVK